MELDLRQLETLCRVAEERSFSRAASVLRLSQAAVSERIASLEQKVGTRLFDRLAREVVLTPVGRMLQERAVELLRREGEIGEELRALLGLETGRVLFGASTIPGTYMLPEVMARLRRVQPGISISLRIASSAQVLAWVESGEIEGGIVGVRSEDHRALYVRPLWRDELAVVVPAGHRWSRRRTLRPAELAEEPFIMREAGSGTRRVIESALGRVRGLLDKIQVVAELGGAGAVKEGVRAGLGISILSGRAVEEDVQAGRLATVTITGIPIERRFHLVSFPGRAHSPAGKRFLGFLQKEGGSGLG